MMEIRPIHTEADYQWALTEVEPYFHSEPQIGSPEGDRFDLLVTLIEKYEADHYPIEAPDPIEAIKIRMDDLGMSRRDLCAAAGVSESKLSEVFNRRRGLSLSMIRSFSRILHLPGDVLLQEYPLMEVA